MSIVRDEKMRVRFRAAAVTAALLIGGAVTAGCSHPAATPAPETHDPTAVAPAPAVAPGTPGAPAAAPSPMSPGDQEEMQRKQNENKGITPPP